MGHIKRMIVQGFKSFAKKTDIQFDKGINLFVGPNGSGKTNVAEALCFVLGRLSAKSMRAAKAKNLIFMGSKYVKPAKEAFVELIFDNSDRAFSIDKDEVNIRRMVRINGQSVYKINDETKTRAEILELLAQAGIDPYGFNLVMQGQIQSTVKMHPEERRKIIEEVAGISIYESRKEKSLHELEKTEERLKEISTILRERTAYLRNLEREKAQAQKYKDTESMIKRAKASIINKKLKDKNKELESIIKSIEDKENIKTSIRSNIEEMQKILEDINEKINQINKHIQKSTGLEQEQLHNEVGNLRASLEGLKVRKENYENKHEEIDRRIQEMSKSIPGIEDEIAELRKESPLMAQKASEVKKKKLELAEIEKEKKTALTLKTELNSINEIARDKDRQLTKINALSESLLRNIEENSLNLEYENSEECSKALEIFKGSLFKKIHELEESNKNELGYEKSISVYDSEIEGANKIKGRVESIDVCPLCQSKITEEHIKHVYDDCEIKIKKAAESKKTSIEILNDIKSKRDNLRKEISEFESKISECKIELIDHKSINEKKEQLKRGVSDVDILKKEIKELLEKRKRLEDKSSDIGNIEDRYQRKILEIEEVSSRTSEDIDTTLLYKERELENMRNIIKRSSEDLKNMNQQIENINSEIEDKSGRLDEVEQKEIELQEKFKKMFETRDSMQKEIQEKNIALNEKQHAMREIEDQANYLRIGKAKIDAEREALNMEFSEYAGVELLSGSLGLFEERLQKSQEAMKNIGSINMRALEVYEEVKKEYDVVQDKVNTLDKEKQDILKIIEEIDRKKTRTFMKTFNAINELFSNNFSKLSSKGVAYLEMEDKEKMFDGGTNIVVKLAKGKYFDVTSLSGGEQTLVALSLLFAIQEYKPYHFYIFDEIDAALDKRNSERLASLLNQYMKEGQYIVITHNDAIITNSNVLYGVSMHEGISKILSLNIGESNANDLSERAPENINESNGVVSTEEI